MAKKHPCRQHKDRPAYARGRCRSCYNSIRRMMKKKGLTTRQAIEAGWFEPSTRLKELMRRLRKAAL